MFQCFVELDAELGNMVANHARALEGYFPPVVNLKKVRTNVAIVGPLIGRLEVHETSLTSAIAHMRTRRQMRHHGDCLKLLKWMEHMHFDASSPNMRGNIRQWRSVFDSLGPDVPVKYNPASGLPMKFSANALG